MCSEFVEITIEYDIVVSKVIVGRYGDPKSCDLTHKFTDSISNDSNNVMNALIGSTCPRNMLIYSAYDLGKDYS